VGNAGNAVQDSGLPDNRLLERLLQGGTLVLDAGDRLCFASAGACELFGAASEAALRDAWDDIGSQLRVTEWPRNAGGAAYHGRADVRTPSGVAAVRFEMHAVGNGGPAERVVLVRDRGRLLPTDAALLLASEALANRHVLMGLVHAANGPLNNFNLTLALLATSIARAQASIAPETGARWTRYVDVLRNESARLANFVEDIHTLTAPHTPSREAIDLGAMLRECARVLRHDATIREIDLELDAPQAPTYAMGDAQLVRLALLAFVICLLDLTPPRGRIGWRLTAGNASSVPAVSITTSHVPLPPDLAASLFALSRTAESPYSAAIAARLIIEAQGGDVALDGNGAGQSGFRIQIPAVD